MSCRNTENFRFLLVLFGFFPLVDIMINVSNNRNVCHWCDICSKKTFKLIQIDSVDRFYFFTKEFDGLSIVSGRHWFALAECDHIESTYSQNNPNRPYVTAPGIIFPKKKKRFWNRSVLMCQSQGCQTIALINHDVRYRDKNRSSCAYSNSAPDLSSYFTINYSNLFIFICQNTFILSMR